MVPEMVSGPGGAGRVRKPIALGELHICDSSRAFCKYECKIIYCKNSM